MGSADRSTPAKSPLFRVPRPQGTGDGGGAEPPQPDTGKLSASRTVSVGEAPADKPSPSAASYSKPMTGSAKAALNASKAGSRASPSSLGGSKSPAYKSSSPKSSGTKPSASSSSTKASPSPRQGKARPRMATLPGGVEVKNILDVAAPDSKRKLQPVPLPWQKPEERVVKSDPAVLLVGADESFLPAIEKALARHKVFVETTELATVVDTVVAAAPDLVMLMGDASRDCGTDVLRKLAESPQSAVVPVVILDDDTALDARLRAFRHGAAAVIPRSASVDAIADQVAKLAREIPERHGAALGEVGDTTLEELVETLATQLRSGILSISAGTGDNAEPVRLVLGQGRPLAELIDDFVGRARKHVLAAEPLHYEFAEHVSGTVRMLDAAHAEQQKAPDSLGDVRIALADSDAARADNIAQELRALGATVIVTDLNPSEVRFARMRQVDPTILLIGEAHVHGEGYELVRRMRHDTRLRWASLLVVRWAELWAENDAAPKTAVQRLAGTLAALAEPENSVCARAKEPHGFDTRLEITGPARCLRALTAANTSIRATVSNPRLTVELDMANQLVVGATAQLVDGTQTFEAATALAAFMQLSSGRVRVQPVQNPATANVMTTIDVALNMADAEPPPIAPSLPAAAGDVAPSVRPAPLPVPTLSLPPSMAPPATASDVETGPADLGPAPARAGEGIRGIKPVTAFVLVGLAAMQGLLLVLLWRAFMRDEPKSVETVAQPAATATAGAPAAAPPATPAAVPKSAAAPKPLALPPSSYEPVDFPVADGSGDDAPTCEELWAQDPPRKGQYPGAAYAKSREANRWITRGDVEKAQHAYCLAVRWDDQNVGFLVGLGNLLLLRRDGAQAVPYLKKALEINPDSSRAQGLLGDALAMTGDYENARAFWLRSSGNAPGNDRALKNLGRRDLKQGEQHVRRREWVHAERMFRRAAVCEPRSIEAAIGLSRSLTEQQDPKPAMSWAKYAVSLDPRSAPARIALGDALAKMGDLSGAQVEWKEAQLLDPTDENARERLRGDE